MSRQEPDYHIPVMLTEAIDGLNVRSGHRYIDCNLGGGGHTAEILRQGGTVLALDIDDNALAHCRERFQNEISSRQLFIIKSNFSNIDEVAHQLGWDAGTVSGILYDLGLSTFQLKHESKGFSFDDDGILDMRMDESLQVRAIDLINLLSEKQLEDIIRDYGEDPQAKHFAKVIKTAVKDNGVNITANELANRIRNASKYGHSRIHPATRVFQSLRIAVNSELENLRQSLHKAALLLNPHGRLVIISFHSLEDKIAKQIAGSPEIMTIANSPLVPSAWEVEQNPPSRSAKLRVYEKK